MTIPLVVVDEHGDCLQGLATALAAKDGKKFELLLHFDSHPDLDFGIFPKKILANLFENSDLRACVPYVDVATWILPVVCSGMVQEVIWVKPPWSEQIKPGTYQLGIIPDKNRIQIGCLEGSPDDCKTYWENSGIWTENLDLKNSHLTHFKLTVVAGPEAVPLQDIKHRTILLDIDEDYLSCSNPSIETMRAFQGTVVVEDLKKIFKPALTDSTIFLNTLGRYVDQQVFRLSRGRSFHPAVKKLASFITSDEEELLRTICLEMTDVYPHTEVPRFADMHELPHHVASAVEVSSSLKKVVKCLESLGEDSVQLVVVAQSVADGYTPAQQAPFIHKCVLSELDDCFGSELLDFQPYPAHYKVLLSQRPSWSCSSLAERPQTLTYELMSEGRISFPSAIVVGSTSSGLVQDDDGLPLIPWEAVRTLAPIDDAHLDLEGHHV